MTRRSTPQRLIDDVAFPVRIKVARPGWTYGPRYDEYLAWLRRLGPDGYAWWGSGLYFRTLQTAAQFLANFPELELDDRAETRSRPGRLSLI